MTLCFTDPRVRRVWYGLSAKLYCPRPLVRSQAWRHQSIQWLNSSNNTYYVDLTGVVPRKLLLNEPRLFHQQCVFGKNCTTVYPDNKVQGANMGLTGVLSAPGGPHVGPMILAIRATFLLMSFAKALFFTKKQKQKWAFQATIILFSEIFVSSRKHLG